MVNFNPIKYNQLV